jgi:hypothetical protein
MNMSKANQATTNIETKTCALMPPGLTDVLDFVLIGTTSGKSTPIPVAWREPDPENSFHVIRSV